MKTLNTWYNGRCFTFNPLDVKVPPAAPIALTLKNPWATSVIDKSSKKAEKYSIYVHDEGLEFNLLSQVIIISNSIVSQGVHTA